MRIQKYAGVFLREEIEQGVKDGEFINELGDEFYNYHVKVI